MDGILKFNVDGSARGKPRLVGISGVLRNSHLFFLPVVIRDSNEAEMLDILQSLWLFRPFSHLKLFIGSDLSDVISWAASLWSSPWRYQFFFNEI